MNWQLGLIAWATGAVLWYNTHAVVVERLKKKDPTVSPVLWDIVCIGISYLWPIFGARLLVKVIKMRMKQGR